MDDSAPDGTSTKVSPAKPSQGPLGWGALAAVLVTLPNFFAMLLPNHELGASMLALHVAAVMLLPCVFGTPLRWVLLAGFPFALLAPVAIFCRLTTGQQPSEWFFLLISETNKSEAAEFFAPVVGGCILTIIVGTLYAWIVFKKTDRRTRIGRFGRIVIAICVFLVPLADSANLGFSWGLSAEAGRLTKSYPVSTATSLAHAAGLRWELDHRANAMAGIAVKQRHPSAGQREIYLLVLGETARADRFQINGYDRPTNPRLSGIDGLMTFRDVVAPAPATVLSVPMLLTPATAPEARDAMKLPSLPAAFRAAGFHVHWLSNQPRHGRWDTTASTFARDADDSRFLGVQLGNEDRTLPCTLDSGLVPLAREILEMGEQKVLLVLHTMGSHGLYSDRYPPDYNRFPADPRVCASAREKLIEGNFTPEEQTALRNAYDNTILFTDSVLADLIGLLRGQNAVSAFYYVSDHGENGGEAPFLPFRHGNLTPEVLRVPLMVWLSPEYRAARPQQTEALQNHLQARISSTTTFHALLELADLACTESNPARSIASPDFQPGPRLVTSLRGDLKDYDRDVDRPATSVPGDHFVTARDKVTRAP